VYLGLSDADGWLWLEQFSGCWSRFSTRDLLVKSGKAANSLGVGRDFPGWILLAIY